MAFSVSQCANINGVLFRRTPDFVPKGLIKDRFPHSVVYSNMYRQETWPLGTGTTHTRDRVHVTRPNDDGCWDEVTLGGDGGATGCDTSCSLSRKVIGWGSTRYSYVKYHQDYTTQPLCYDQFRNVEEIINQLSAIVEGLKQEPDMIVSDFLRLLSIRKSDKLHIAGKDLITVDVTDGMFLQHCKRIDLGGTGNLPTSKLTMEYLDNHVEDLQYNGYFDREFLPQGTFAITTDIQTFRNLSVQNPVLTQMYALPEFSRGGRYFEYGLMGKQIGNWVFKLDNEQMRFQHVGNGVLERIWPFENVDTTVGKKPQFSQAYKHAPYAAYHVYNRDARTVYVGDISPVNSEMKFNMSRNLLGQWKWMSPDYFTFRDPNTGQECAYNNDKHNMGYLLGEFELGMETMYPEIEMWIIAQREPQGVANDPRCAATPSQAYQSLTPYNELCASEED